MSEPTTSNRSAAIAAAVILLGTGLVFLIPAGLFSAKRLKAQLKKK